MIIFIALLVAASLYWLIEIAQTLNKILKELQRKPNRKL